LLTVLPLAVVTSPPKTYRRPFSTAAAMLLRAVGKAPSRHKALIDQEAARNLLETYLRQQRGLH
jgi:RNase H-fold protein (predicted Holliday junction resolvase)